MNFAARFLVGGASIFAFGGCTAASDVVLGTGPEPGAGGRGTSVNGAAGGAPVPPPAAGSGGNFMTFPVSSGGAGGCATIVQVQEQQSREIMLLLDRSESMARTLPDPGSGTWWSAVSDASLRFYNDALLSGAGLGLQLFPQLSPSSCSADYSVPAESIARLGERPGSILQAMGGVPLQGRNSLAPALSGVLRYTAMRALSDGIAHRHVVLVSGGLPDECEPREMTGIAEIARDAFDVDGVRTHVIGVNLGDAGPAFHAVAEAGGTGTATLIDDGDITGQLLAAMRRVIAPNQDCHWVVPEPPPGVTGTARERIMLTEQRGSAAPRIIHRLASKADCALNSDSGWYLEPALDGGRPVAWLCPGSCAESAGAQFNIVFGCGATAGN